MKVSNLILILKAASSGRFPTLVKPVFVDVGKQMVHWPSVLCYCSTMAVAILNDESSSK